MNITLNRDMLLYTTEKCNMNCSYCYNDININKAKMSDIESYKNLKDFIDFLIKNNIIDKIMLTWWEPFQWPHLEKFISDYNWKKKITIFTNWTFIKDKIDILEWWIEIKLALHWLVWNKDSFRYYTKIIKLLEEKWIKYWLIYLISKQNFHRFYEDYVNLRSASKTDNFSLKYQPVIIPESNTKFLRWEIPIKITPKNLKNYEDHSLSWLSENDWWIFRDNILKVINYEKDYREKNLIGSNISVYWIGDKSLEYHEMLKQFYLKWKKVDNCDTWPIIVLWSDWNLYQCMFLFNSPVWNIHNLITEESKLKVIDILATKNLKEIKCAKCFSEECLGALRPI